MGRKTKEKTNDLRDLGRLDNQIIQDDSGTQKQTINNSTNNTSVVVCDLGIDISTAIIGLALIDSSTNKTVATKAIVMNTSKFKDVDRFDKADFFEADFSSWIQSNNCQINKIFVEEAHMAFAQGFSSAGTLMMLARFNETICYILYKKFGIKPNRINVRSARSRLKLKLDKTKDRKEQVRDYVIAATAKETHIHWPTSVVTRGDKKGQTVYKAECCDIADAWVIVRGGKLI